MNAYLNQYRANDVSTASPERLLIMMYDGAIRNVARAREAILAGERLPKLEGIRKAVAIVTELSNTLDFEVGGEIAENLDALYGYMTRELSQGSLQNDAQRLIGVETMLKDLRETWLQAIEVARQEKAEAAEVLGAPPAPDYYKPFAAAL